MSIKRTEVQYLGCGDKGATGLFDSFDAVQIKIQKWVAAKYPSSNLYPSNESSHSKYAHNLNEKASHRHGDRFHREFLQLLKASGSPAAPHLPRIAVVLVVVLVVV